MTAPPLGVLGAGWVGLVTAACFAELGHEVVVRDVVPQRIADLQAGRVPIYEPGLTELVGANRERLRFTESAAELFEGARVVFVCVGTPPTYSGDADLTAVHRVLEELPTDGRPLTLVMKSTVPVGTGAKVLAELAGRGIDAVTYVSNPEFLAESTAIRDFMHPDRVVVGSFGEEEGALVASLYRFTEAPIVRTDVATAEMIKYASNAFLATKISFINEIANVCDETGADVARVAEGMGHDRRIGPHFLRPGIGYSGNCLVGSETVLVRQSAQVRLVRLDTLFAELAGGADVAYFEPIGLDALSWSPDRGCHFAGIALVCRRLVDGELIEIRTTMGRRVTCTPDHPFVTTRAPKEDAYTIVKEAQDLDEGDWLPLALGASSELAPVAENAEVLEGLAASGLVPEDVIVRPAPGLLHVLGRAAVRAGVAELRPARGAAARAHDVVRAEALRLPEACALNLALDGATAGTARSGTYVPLTISTNERFWRIVGLYLAEGSCSIDEGRYRLTWSFHPTNEDDLVDEVWSYWTDVGLKPSRRRAATAAHVSVSSRILGGYWLGVLGAGVGCYDHRIPDLLWGAPPSDKRTLLAGLWRGDGSWSLVAGGPSVVLEYGTVSRDLADGVLRLLGEAGIVARLEIGHSRKSTRDMHWLTVSGADQVERLLDFVPEAVRDRIRQSLAAQAKRIAPTGYRESPTAAWVRVVSTRRRAHRGWVYSLEVPGSETFVTTGGLITHNCLPKDVAALKQLAGNSGYHFQLLTAVIEVNELQKRRVLGKLSKHLGPLRGKTVTLLGLAFKPNTNDMREASSLVLSARLLAEGATVRGWDPAALDEARKLMSGVEFHDDLLASLQGADAAIVVTEWDEVKRFPFVRAHEAMRSAVLIDGRNVLDPAEARSHGFAYESIGRPSAIE